MNVAFLLREYLAIFWKYLKSPCIRLDLIKRFPSCKFYQHIFVDKNTIIGKNVVLFDNVTVENSDIGNNTFVQKNSSINNCTIGKYCSIATNVFVGIGNHPTDHVSTHPSFYSNTLPIVKTYVSNNKFKFYEPVVIGNDVWVGQNVLILDGIKIGNGAIIAAGAVVTKNVAPYEIVGGVPAKNIRYRFSPDVIERLEKLSWWDRPDQWLKENAVFFSDPITFLEKYN